VACNFPLRAWRGDVNPETGKRRMLLKEPVFRRDEPPGTLPCGKCQGCLLSRALTWTLRCVQEASLHESNECLTLTYDDDHLPKNNSLSQADIQKFFKRLRKSFPGREPRYYYCGEYGDRKGRPHYHVLLFNFSFDDKVKLSGEGDRALYTSETLTKIWGLGHAAIGSVTPESAAYVARYVLKKQVQKRDEEKGRVPEYTRMSRRPGIGAGWIDRFKTDVYPSSLMLHDGKKYSVPRYYDSRVEKIDPSLVETSKEIRALAAQRRLERVQHKTGRSALFNLRNREVILAQKVKQYQRPLDEKLGGDK